MTEKRNAARRTVTGADLNRPSGTGTQEKIMKTANKKNQKLLKHKRLTVFNAYGMGLNGVVRNARHYLYYGN
jgi:hypothetical protein